MKDSNLKQAIRNMVGSNEELRKTLSKALCDEVPDSFRQKLNIGLTAMGVRDYNDCYYDPIHEVYMRPAIFEYDDQQIDFYRLPLGSILDASRDGKFGSLDELVNGLDNKALIGSIEVSVEEDGLLSDNDLCLDEIENRLADDGRWVASDGWSIKEFAKICNFIIAKDKKYAGDKSVDMHKARLSDKANTVQEINEARGASTNKSAPVLSGDAR